MVEIENYGQWLDLKPPKNKKAFKIICHCPKCGKRHIRSYLDLQHSKEYIYCTKHKTERAYEAKYGKGVTCAQLIPGVAEKTSATKAEKYGEDWGQQWYSAQKEKVMSSLGVENPGLAPDHMIKCYESMAKRYGSVERGWQVRQKHIEDTAEKNYGSYEEYTKLRLESQLDSLRDKYEDPTIKNIVDIPELKEKRFEKYLDNIQYFDRIKILFKNGNYVFHCLDCGYETPIFYENRLYRCPQCNKKIKPRGLIMSVSSFIDKFGIKVENDFYEPSVGLNFDIYIPSEKLAIDIISTSTHSNIDQYYLRDRFDLCEKNGIKLISLFEDFWYEKPEAVRSRIKTLLNLNSSTVDGLKGHVTEITVSDYEDFCEANHIYGKAGASLKLGLRVNGILVSVMGLRTPMYRKEYNWEIARFCYKNDYTVENALKSFIIWMDKNRPGDSIIYYHDKRWPIDVNNSMEELQDSVPSIHYWKGDGKLQPWTICKKSWNNRNNFDFERDLPIIQNMLKEGYNIIYDCGFKLFVYG